MKKILFLLTFSSAISIFAQNYDAFPFKKGDKYGYQQRGTEKIIVTPKYDYAGKFEGDYAIVGKGEKYGMINKEGKEVIVPKYSNKFKFAENFGVDGTFAMVEFHGKYGLIDAKGKEIVPPRFADKIELTDDFNFPGGLAKVALGDYHGLFSLQEQKEVVPCKFDKNIKYAGINFEGTHFYVVSKDKRLGIITYPFTVMVPCKYDKMEVDKFVKPDDATQLIPVEYDKKQGFLALDGKEAIPCKYDAIEPSSEKHLFYVKQNGKYGLFNAKTRMIAVTCKYEEMEKLWEVEYPKLAQ